MPPPARLAPIHRDLLRWYRRSARDFPWRRTHDPYRILVSEVMLQQTQVSRVVPFYQDFLRQFPNLRTLGAASPGSVLRAWRGLGYNMRALRLRKLAVHLRDERHGRFPQTVEDLEALPGIGPYTARAVACFAFGLSVPVLDTNVRRVFLRLFPDRSRKENLWDLARNVLPQRSAYDWNQGLMELGSTICTASVPACDQCPIQQHCPSAGRALRHTQPGPSREKLYRGFPRRIYRGRIVGILTRSSRRAISFAHLGRELFPSFTHRDTAYLQTTLDALEKDGLVERQRRGRVLTVSLAQ